MNAQLETKETLKQPAKKSKQSDWIKEHLKNQKEEFLNLAQRKQISILIAILLWHFKPLFILSLF